GIAYVQKIRHGSPFPWVSGASSRERQMSLHRLPHVAILVLLAAAARAGVVAANSLGAVADRLGLLLGLLTARDGRFLLCADARLGHGRRRRRLVHHGADGPDRLLEAFVVLHLENGVGRFVGEAGPHRVEFFHALALVLGLWINLGVTHEADALPQMVHRVQ